MPADQLLNRVLADYQTLHNERQTESLFGTTLTLLTDLGNPLNLSLLTSQFLTAPAIWHRQAPDADPLQSICMRVLSVFHSAAIHVRRNELENADKQAALGFGINPSPPAGGGLTSAAWTRAVVKGADERSSRWQHLLVLAGLFMGFEGNGRQSLGGSIKRTLETAVVTAANLALHSLEREPPVASAAIVLALNWAFPLMSELAGEGLDWAALLPVAIDAMVGEPGFQGGLFLASIGADVRQVGHRLDWPDNSLSFAGVRELGSKPLVEAAGPLSRLIAHAVERAGDHRLVLQVQDRLLAFTSTLLAQWGALHLSEVEMSEEGVAFTENALQVTLPALWRLLTNVLFAVVAILRAVTARSLLDPQLRTHATGPVVAAKTLHMYRHLYFIASRGNDSFQAYTFSYLASIDILARHGEPSIAFLRACASSTPGLIPSHALAKTLDLFYLNTAEHLPLNIPPEACEALIIQPATVYLSHSAPHSRMMMELFEAAHSAVLSVLSCPQNGPVAVTLAPFYAETLLASFPARVSPRQFRLAFSTLMQILSPPFPVSATRPELAETLLEMVHLRIPQARQSPLPAAEDQSLSAPPPTSEQSALALTLIDALPYLPLPIVEEWMDVAAEALHQIVDPMLKDVTKQRFWEILGSGEMDVERAAIGVAWWGTKGGRELVLFGPRRLDSVREPLMSGALVDDSGMSRL